MAAKSCIQARKYVSKESILALYPEETSPKIQQRGISCPTKRTDQCPIIVLMKTILLITMEIASGKQHDTKFRYPLVTCVQGYLYIYCTPPPSPSADSFQTCSLGESAEGFLLKLKPLKRNCDLHSTDTSQVVLICLNYLGNHSVGKSMCSRE